MSFDIELSRITACKTIILDPTPKSIKHWENIIESYKTGCSFSINNNDDEIYNFENFNQSRFTFCKKALWENKNIEMFSPRNRCFAHSFKSSKKFNVGFVAQAITFPKFCELYKITELKFIKLDIEGQKNMCLWTF